MLKNLFPIKIKIFKTNSQRSSNENSHKYPKKEVAQLEKEYKKM